MTRRSANFGVGTPGIRWRAVALALFALVLGLAISHSIGISFIIDDRHFALAARQWAEHAPYVGKTHWELRNAIVLPLALLMRIWPDDPLVFFLLPAVYFVGFFLLFFSFFPKRIGWGASLLAAALLLATPIVRDYGGRFYPDFIELFWVGSALMLLYRAWELRDIGHRAGQRRWLLAASGLATALAIMTRETAAWMVLLYGWLLLRGRPFSRGDVLMVAAGAAPLLVADWLFLYAKTGDILYRFHVITAHTDIPSAHLRGGVYRGQVLLNPDLAARWTVDGPIYVHWAINPILYFFLDIRYCLLWWWSAIVACVAWRSGGIPRQYRGLLWALVVVAVVAFVFPTYVLMVSQRPRYYLVTLCCVALIGGILGAELWRQGRVRWLLKLLLAVQIVVMLVSLDMRSSRMTLPWAAADLVKETREPVYMRADLAEAVYWAVPRATFARFVRVGKTPVGHKELTVEDWIAARKTHAKVPPPLEGCWARSDVRNIYRTGWKATLYHLTNSVGLPVKSLHKLDFRLILHRKVSDAPCPAGRAQSAPPPI
ncbi:glycosyltransferase family 39 protein [Sphingobium subterraneum]|uniref:4-amino-4-deoxy-L-arabinose transferase-like glycosyltransferase n=1 Tax=Sphingobium subterraneum TaxID=627688 RepID=A0A841J328_9SPHN|nr:glycosyltransferase family 39 protein [Sphingobium subterraneum]MBB6123926.1 4-amino-4-deoxy-L-arabinose transferase-like glycosyltransferase [Sphingobium subterraneum]